ncbi:DUF2147 domain-containing protein [Jiella avicenniae]|uniref:DUF2147 domain-containing protein n=1 Tax=Jiella avicenniae TaxID=2907202 RepID=A0A9X1P0W9_9HYPH|nr:DUF2147 domain-containing protein [Jiella avicenniae]MCE7027261.1 DUF2147 domain-containing protein [Jiella avicenniae]
MTHRPPTVAVPILLLANTAGGAHAAPPIAGTPVSEDGTTIAVAGCDAGLCATVASGRYRGQWVARVAGSPPDDAGRVRDPRSGETYDGGLRLHGGRLDLRGCLAKVFCRTVQRWQRP